MKIKNNKQTCNQNGITLISLIITIIILIILAGVVIKLSMGKNGILNRTQQAKQNQNEETAREKLELILSNIRIEKETNNNYNDDCLNDLLEEEGITVDGDSVIVDNYNFLIDRDKLMIKDSLGETQTRELKLDLKNENYSGDTNYITKNDDGSITITYPNSGWGNKYACISNINISQYNKISITYSFKAGYSYSFNLATSTNNIEYTLFSSEPTLVNKSVEKTTVTYDIPKDKEYNGITLGACSLGAKLYIYDITLN